MLAESRLNGWHDVQVNAKCKVDLIFWLCINDIINLYWTVYFVITLKGNNYLHPDSVGNAADKTYIYLNQKVKHALYGVCYSNIYLYGLLLVLPCNGIDG